MKVSAVLLMSLLAVSPALAQWETQAASIRDSIVYIENTQGSCTGAVINNEKDLVLTAAHCDGPELFVDQSPAKVLSKDVKNDLMVLEVKDIDRPALKLALKNPVVGQEVATYGYGYGLERPLFRTHTVSDNETQIPELPYRYIAVDSAFIPGQSGGPVVDKNGAIVAIVQRGNSIIGLGLGAETIRGKVGKFFAK